MKLSVIICVSVAFIATLGIVAVIIVTGHDITPFLLSITTVGSAVAILFGINQVQKQTNGTLSKALADKDSAVAKAADLQTHVVALGGTLPPPIPEPTTPDATIPNLTGS